MFHLLSSDFVVSSLAWNHFRFTLLKNGFSNEKTEDVWRNSKPNRQVISVTKFIANIQDEQRRKDCKVVMKLMGEATSAKPEMWGSSIVGFGRRRIKYSSGREIDWMMIGFSPRKSELTLYLTGGPNSFPKLMNKLGKYKAGKGCLYIKKLDDVNVDVLRELIDKSVEKFLQD